MNAPWAYVPLKEACQIKPPKKEARERLEKTDRVSFVPMNYLGAGAKYFAPIEEKPFPDVSGSYTYFAEGDILLAKITPCFENGKLGIARGLTNGTGFGSSEFVVLRTNQNLDPEFLFYYLSQDSFRHAGQSVMSGAVGHKRVPKEFIENHEIPVPTLPEQKHIVAILDEAFAGIDTAIANTEKNLANASELFGSYLNFILTRNAHDWIQRKLHECLRLRSGDGLRKSGMKSGDYPVYGGNGISGTHNDFNLSGDNVIIGRVGALCGNSKHITRAIWLTDNAFKVLDKKHGFDNRFLVYLLNFVDLRSYARQAAQPVISNSSLKDVSLRFPESVTLQKEIALGLDGVREKISRLEEVYAQKNVAMLQLKQSLLQKAFSGELTAGKMETKAKETLA